MGRDFAHMESAKEFAVKNDNDPTWMYRIMEIRKDPACATPEEIQRLATDLIYSMYCTMPKNPFADLAQILTHHSNTYRHESK